MCGWSTMELETHLNIQKRWWVMTGSKSPGRSSHSRSSRANGTNILSFSEL